jgi:hypothetical protein
MVPGRTSRKMTVQPGRVDTQYAGQGDIANVIARGKCAKILQYIWYHTVGISNVIWHDNRASIEHKIPKAASCSHTVKCSVWPEHLVGIALRTSE